MNSNVQRFLPPALVFAAASYFGWPTSESLLREEPIVQASSVRWRGEDLQSPAKPEITKNPFDSVLIASEEQEVEEETGKLIPATKPLGPDISELSTGFRLTGIAQMGSVRWAILNGRPAKLGDIVETQNSYRQPCEIIAVESDHVIARCQETTVTIKNTKNQAVQKPSLSSGQDGSRSSHATAPRASSDPSGLTAATADQVTLTAPPPSD